MQIRTTMAAAALLLSAHAATADVVTVSPVVAGPWGGGGTVAWFAAGENAKSKGGWEVGAGADPDAPAATADRKWTKGQPTPFSLVYDADTGLAAWTIGTTSLTFDAAGAVSMLVLSAQALSGSAKKEHAMLLTDLSLDLFADAGGPVALPNLGASAEARSVHLTISEEDVPFSGGFTLRGNATISWKGGAPTDDRIAFAVLGVGPALSPAMVPAPGTVLLVAGSVGLLGIRRRR